VGNNGTGATVINLGGAGDTVNIYGTLNNITTTNTQVMDKTLVLNSGGTAATAGSAGIYFEEAGSSANSYVRVSSDRSKMEMKAPTGSLISFNQSLTTSDSPLFKQFYCNAFDMSTTPLTGAAFIAWNRESGSGRTLFATQQGGGTGGWEWMNYKSDNTVYNANPQMTLDRDGNLAVTGNISTSVAPTTGSHLTNKTYVDGKFATDLYQGWSTTFNGPTGLTSSMDFRIGRVGHIVTITCLMSQSASATAATNYSSVSKLPAEYRPSTTASSVISICNGSTTYEPGMASVALDGSITMRPLNGTFSGAGHTTWSAWTMSYVVA